VCAAKHRAIAGLWRAVSTKSSSDLRSHTWQAAQKYGGAPPIASCRRSSRATRSVLGILKSSIASNSFRDGVQAESVYVAREREGVKKCRTLRSDVGGSFKPDDDVMIRFSTCTLASVNLDLTTQLLLPLLYYSIGIDTSFENILKGFDYVLRWRLDHRNHVCDRRLEEWTETVDYL
jgi:hypothetical protein